MRAADEIRNKIDEYLAKIEKTNDAELNENYCRILDALLWVIEDASGADI